MRAQPWCKLPVIATILLGGCGIDTVTFELGSPKTENNLGQPRLDSPDAALSVPVWERPRPEDETDPEDADPDQVGEPTDEPDTTTEEPEDQPPS